MVRGLIFPELDLLPWLSLLLILLVAGCQEQPVNRAQPPPPGPPHPSQFPAIQREILPNGLRVVLAEHHEIPLVSVRLVVRSGASFDLSNRAGLASLVAAVLDEGTMARSAIELAEALEFLGAGLTMAVNEDGSVIRLDVPAESFADAFELMSEVVRRPAFDPAEVERVRKERLADLLRERDDPRALASALFGRFVYGDRPYGTPAEGTEESIRAIRREEILEFYRTHYRPNNAVLIVAGDLTMGRLHPLVEERLGGWEEKPLPVAPDLAPPRIDQPRVFLVNRPGSVQSELRIGHVGVSRSSEDYFPLLVMNSILGGQFTSRLNLNLREARGYTYGARSNFDFRRGPGPFIASAAVHTAVTDSSVVEVLKELREITRGVTEEELAFAKRYLSGQLPLTLETASDLASRILEIELYGLPDEYFETYRDRIGAVTLEDVQRVAQQYLHPDRVAIVVVGAAEEVHSGLARIAPVSFYDQLGRPLGT